MGGPTFEQFAGHYLAFLQSKKLKDLDRPTTIVKKHLISVFGSLPLVSLQLNHGLQYLEHRRAQQAAEGTMERECTVLLGMLNHAVATDVLDKNRLALLPILHGARRERMAEPWELSREGKLIQTHMEWLIQRSDGYWIVPALGSRLKRVPKSLPMNKLALTMFQGEQTRITGRFFEQWKDGIPSSIVGSMPANVWAYTISTITTCAIRR